MEYDKTWMINIVNLLNSQFSCLEYEFFERTDGCQRVQECFHILPLRRLGIYPVNMWNKSLSRNDAKHDVIAQHCRGK